MARHDISLFPEQEQFAYWHDVICREFTQLTPARRREGKGFASHVDNRPLGELNRARLGSQEQHVAHGPAEVARIDGEHLFVNVQVAGSCHVTDGERHGVVRPGQLTVVDTSRPYWFDFDGEWKLLSYRLPRRLLPDPDRFAAALCVPVEASAGVGAVLAGAMAAAWDVVAEDPEVARPLGESLVAATSAVLAAVAARPPAVTEPRPGGSMTAIRLAVLRHVRAHLGDPGLGVTQVCRTFAISPRTLHYAFAGGESFAETVRATRLEAIARELRDPLVTDPVTAIAARHGMPDPTTFARGFRRRFACSPREYRRETATRPDPRP